MSLHFTALTIKGALSLSLHFGHNQLLSWGPSRGILITMSLHFTTLTKRGAHSLSLHFIHNQSLSWGPRPARGPLEGDTDNSVIALYYIDYQRGALTVCRCILFITSRCLGAQGQLGAPSNCLVCLPSRDGPYTHTHVE